MALNRDDIEAQEIQRYIDRYRNLTIAQLHNKLFEATELTPPQEQNLSLQYALEWLLEQADPAPQQDPAAALAAFQATHRTAIPPKTKRIKRILIAVAVIAALLLCSLTGYAIHHYGLFLNVQSEYTQPRVVPGPDSLVSTWTGKPVPTYVVDGFSINDAGVGHGLHYIEYKNIEDELYYVYFYSSEAGIALDTEDAAQSSFLLGNTTVYQVDKDGLCQLTWNINLTIAEITFYPEQISVEDMKLVAESMVVPDSNG